jgi:hypothetical protein
MNIQKNPQTISGLRVFDRGPAEWTLFGAAPLKDAGSEPSLRCLDISSQSAVNSGQAFATGAWT